MKRIIQLILCLVIICSGNITLSQAKNRKEKDKNFEDNKASKQILVIGLKDNIKSNYFYDKMIAEESGIELDSLDIKYNSIITDNISFYSKDAKYLSFGTNQYNKTIEKIRTKGEDEEAYSDLSFVPTSELQSMLSNANAEYLLVLNQHYLKWQETPYRTIFHIVSYSLFDKNKNEIYRGNSYFSCVNLENAEQLKKLSKKCSSKIAESVSKAIAKN